MKRDRDEKREREVKNEECKSVRLVIFLLT